MDDNLSWNLNYNKTQMEMFKCGHGTCKPCYSKLTSEFQIICSIPETLSNVPALEWKSLEFSCPLCRGDEQKFKVGFFIKRTESWTTFAEWYNDYEIYIKSGSANNILNNTVFGKQLLRLLREEKKRTKSKI